MERAWEHTGSIPGLPGERTGHSWECRPHGKSGIYKAQIPQNSFWHQSFFGGILPGKGAALMGSLDRGHHHPFPEPRAAGTGRGSACGETGAITPRERPGQLHRYSRNPWADSLPGTEVASPRERLRQELPGLDIAAMTTTRSQLRHPDPGSAPELARQTPSPGKALPAQPGGQVRREEPRDSPRAAPRAGKGGINLGEAPLSPGRGVLIPGGMWIPTGVSVPGRLPQTRLQHLWLCCSLLPAPWHSRLHQETWGTPSFLPALREGQ